MLYRLLNPSKLPGREAVGPWRVYWADDWIGSYGSFATDTLREVDSWVRDTLEGFPSTTIAVASSNGFVYRVFQDEKNKVIYEREWKNEKENTTNREKVDKYHPSSRSTICGRH